MLDRKIAAFKYPYDYPDWRWQRARALVLEGEEPEKCDDKYVRRAVLFLKDLDASQSGELEHFKVSAKHKAIARSLNIKLHRGNRRNYLEALLLCADANLLDIASDIADSDQSSLSFVRTYTKLFFDIRGSLNNPTYLCSKVLEPLIMHEAFSGKDPNLAWKLGAIYGGKQVVKTFWAMGAAAPSIIDWFTEVARTVHARDLAFGSYFRPLNQYTMVNVSDHMVRAAELELKQTVAGALTGDGASKADMLNGLISSVNMMMAPESTGAEIPAREPRIHERIRSKLDEAQEIQVIVT